MDDQKTPIRSRKGKSKTVSVHTKDKESGNTLNKDSRDLLILVVDVDQGECTLVVERVNEKPVWTAIIDGGYSVPGRGALIRYVNALQIEQIDLMVCTHFDRDHADGLLDFIEYHHELIPVKRLYLRDVVEFTKAANTVQRMLLKTAGELKIEVKEAEVDEVLKGKDGLSLHCLASTNGPLFEENYGSIALLLTYNGFSYYTAGDLPSDAEKSLIEPIQKLLPKNSPLAAMKCGHHGSDGSTPAELITGLKPSWAFISCGRQSFGHPTYGAIERLVHEKSPVEKFYLTNCFHNRRSINPEYAEQEKELWEKYRKILKDALDEVKKNDSKSDIDYKLDLGKVDTASKVDAVETIDDWREKVKQSKVDDKEELLAKLRTARRYAKAAEKARAHFLQEGLRDKEPIGIVAGSDTQLGTIVIRVAPQDKESLLIETGCFQESDWAWELHPWSKKCKTDKGLRKDLSDTLQKAIEDKEDSDSDDDQSIEGTTTDQSNLNSPQKYKEHREVNRFGQYRRFDCLTVTGLQERKDKLPFFPFCAFCRDDEESDKGGLIHQACPTCMDDYIYYHPGCCESTTKEDMISFTKEQLKQLQKLQKSTIPTGIIEDIDLAAELCPSCHGGEVISEKKDRLSEKREANKCLGCGQELNEKNKSGGEWPTLRCKCKAHKESFKTVAVTVCKICYSNYAKKKTSFQCVKCRPIKN